MISHQIITKARPVFPSYAQTPIFTTQEQLDDFLKDKPKENSWVVYQSISDDNISLLALYHVLKVCRDIKELKSDYANKPQTHYMCNFHQEYLRLPAWENIAYFRQVDQKIIDKLKLDTDDFVQNRIKTCTALG